MDMNQPFPNWYFLGQIKLILRIAGPAHASCKIIPRRPFFINFPASFNFIYCKFLNDCDFDTQSSLQNISEVVSVSKSYNCTAVMCTSKAQNMFLFCLHSFSCCMRMTFKSDHRSTSQISGWVLNVNMRPGYVYLNRSDLNRK